MHDKDNQPVYKIQASCFQLAFWLNCKCEACTKVEFEIKDASKNDFVIGKMIKQGKSCCGDPLNSDADNFSMEFPRNATWRHKALLVTTAVFIDFMMFEDSGSKKR